MVLFLIRGLLTASGHIIRSLQAHIQDLSAAFPKLIVYTSGRVLGMRLGH